MVKNALVVIGLLPAVALLTGCQSAEQPAPVAVAAAPKPQAKQPRKPKPKVESEAVERDALRQEMTDYVAPFPNRNAMFVPPKIDSRVRGSRVGEGDVQLKGLVDVDQPRAILDIEGATTLLAVGGEKYGVKVVSIENNEVTLQRGPTKWVASLD